jgi:hypothetical protein
MAGPSGVFPEGWRDRPHELGMNALVQGKID